jgi:hypothetical protein
MNDPLKIVSFPMNNRFYPPLVILYKMNDLKQQITILMIILDEGSNVNLLSRLPISEFEI